ncbi:uncharacterized protein MKZ38_010087 [Zalerion maritima]|uniref:Uncharacterized protein n=1 Tax=Zalerion maritima TaxID=339359 RepID=A0AAD5WT63_9PEZI|nr:uncharacterized protein MKZ38_010087 [Zalerion maritima]
MYTSTIILSALAVLAAAVPPRPLPEATEAATTTPCSVQATMTSMIIPYESEGVSPLASVISADATATTFELNCPPGTDSSDCGFGPGITVVNVNDEDGQKQHYTYILGAMGVSATTTIYPKVTGACEVSGGGEGGEDGEDGEEDLEGICQGKDGNGDILTATMNLERYVYDVEVTAGAEKLPTVTVEATVVAAAAQETGTSAVVAAGGARSSGIQGLVVAGVAVVAGAMVW